MRFEGKRAFESAIKDKTICFILIGALALGACQSCSARNEKEDLVIKDLRGPTSLLTDAPSASETRAILAERGASVRPKVIEALHHKESKVREGAAIVLGLMGPKAKDGIPALIVALKDRESNVRLSAATAIWQIDQSACDVTPALIAALKDADSPYRDEVTGALAGKGPEQPEASPDLRLALIEALKDRSEIVRFNSAIALSHINPPAKEAISILLSDTCSTAAVDALAKFGREAKDELFPALIAMAIVPKDRTYGCDYYHTLTKILAKIGPVAEGAAPALIEGLKDQKGYIRFNSAIALAHIKPLEAKKAIPILIENCNYAGAEEALAQIGQVAKNEVTSALIMAMTTERKNTSAYLYEAQADVLLKIGGAKKATPVLISALADQDPSIGSLAAQALGKLGPQAKAAAPALKKAINDSDRRVADEAASALSKIKSESR